MVSSPRLKDQQISGISSFGNLLKKKKKRHFQPSAELELKVMQKNFEWSVLLYCDNTAKTHSLLDSVDCLSQKVPNTGLKILI